MNQLTPLQLINSGALDAELDQIEAAVRHRRQSQIYTLVEGQDVWFNNTVNPKYLVGRHAKVLEINRVRIVVKLVNNHPGERFQGKITVPLTIIANVKPAYAVD